MKKPMRTLLVAAATALAVAVPAVTATAADDPTPPTSPMGIHHVELGDPASNDLFSISATSWTGYAGFGTPSANGQAITITANQDISLRVGGKGQATSWSDPDLGMWFSHAGVCPDIQEGVTWATMSAGDTCQFWGNFGPDAMDQLGVHWRDLVFNARTADGTTASQPFRSAVETKFVVAGENLDFGEVPLGTTPAAQTFTVRNISPTPVVIDLAPMTTKQPFDLAPGQPTVFTLAPDATTDIAVTFTPTQLGTADSMRVSAFINAVGDTYQAPQYLSRFIGVGVARQAALIGNPVDFGTVDPGSSHQQPVTLTNTGPVPLTLTAEPIVQDGAPATPEDIQVDLPTTEVAPGETVTGTVTWNTATTGFTSTVRVTGTDAAATTAGVLAATPATATIALTGAVAAPPATTPAPEVTTPPAADRTPEPVATTSAASHAGSGADRLATTGSETTTWILGAAAGALLAGALLVGLRRLRRTHR